MNQSIQDSKVCNSFMFFYLKQKFFPVLLFCWIGLGLGLFASFCQDGAAVPFRYSVQPKAMVNAFEPKALTEDLDAGPVRSSVMGAACIGNLKKLPKSEHASILWEVPQLKVLSIENQKCFAAWMS